MALLLILLYAPAVLLLVRAYTSNDPRWMRVLAVLAAAASLALPLTAYIARWDLSAALGLAPFGAAAFYLLAWSAFSRDRPAERILSLAVALASTFPLLLLYLFTPH